MKGQSEGWNAADDEKGLRKVEVGLKPPKRALE